MLLGQYVITYYRYIIPQLTFFSDS